MSDSREIAITLIAIQKSLIEAGMTTPGEEIETTIKQHYDIHQRLVALHTCEEKRVFNPPNNPSNPGGAFTIMDIEDKGNYVRANIKDLSGKEQWVSAWDGDADMLRGASAGDGLDCKLVKKGNFTNVKEAKIHSNIPF